MPDTFFKILGGTAPINQSLGLMTQGIGYPLRDVEPAVSGGDVTVRTEESLQASDFTDQEPTGLGVALQVLFGGVQATTWFSVDALGNVTCLVTDEYQARFKFSTGREGAAGESQIYLRFLLNGTQFGNSTHTIIDNSRIEIPSTYEGTLSLTAGDILTCEIIRDTDGDDSGGLRAGNPDVVGWNPSPSAQITFSRNIAVTP